MDIAKRTHVVGSSEPSGGGSEANFKIDFARPITLAKRTRVELQELAVHPALSLNVEDGRNTFDCRILSNDDTDWTAVVEPSEYGTMDSLATELMDAVSSQVLGNEGDTTPPDRAAYILLDDQSPGFYSFNFEVVSDSSGRFLTIISRASINAVVDIDDTNVLPARLADSNLEVIGNSLVGIADAGTGGFYFSRSVFSSNFIRVVSFSPSTQYNGTNFSSRADYAITFWRNRFALDSSDAQLSGDFNGIAVEEQNDGSARVAFIVNDLIIASVTIPQADFSAGDEYTFHLVMTRGRIAAFYKLTSTGAVTQLGTVREYSGSITDFAVVYSDNGSTLINDIRANSITGPAGPTGGLEFLLESSPVLTDFGFPDGFFNPGEAIETLDGNRPLGFDSIPSYYIVLRGVAAEGRSGDDGSDPSILCTASFTTTEAAAGLDDGGRHIFRGLPSSYTDVQFPKETLINSIRVEIREFNGSLARFVQNRPSSISLVFHPLGDPP